MCDNRPRELVTDLNQYPFIRDIDQNELGDVFKRGLYGINRINNGSCCYHYVTIEDNGTYKFHYPVENTALLSI